MKAGFFRYPADKRTVHVHCHINFAELAAAFLSAGPQTHSEQERYHS